MASKSACQAAKAKAIEAESSKTAPADLLGDELAKLKVSLSTFSEDFMSQIDSIKAQREREERGLYIFSQPTRLYRCARFVSNLVNNISTKRLSCLNSLK
ncbi:TPA: hypothetical protein ACH3X1_013489 [Trebouxia sp. C0004]